MVQFGQSLPRQTRLERTTPLEEIWAALVFSEYNVNAMKVHTRKRWLSPESYVEVRYRRNWTQDGLGHLDVYWFAPDPRKAQYHKLKFNSVASSHGPVNPNFEGWNANDLFAGNPHYRKVIVAAREIVKELRLTSSDSRAAA